MQSENSDSQSSLVVPILHGTENIHTRLVVEYIYASFNKRIYIGIPNYLVMAFSLCLLMLKPDPLSLRLHNRTVQMRQSDQAHLAKSTIPFVSLCTLEWMKRVYPSKPPRSNWVIIGINLSGDGFGFKLVLISKHKYTNL